LLGLRWKRFNSPVRHAGKLYSWQTLIRLKAHEFANFMLDGQTELDFDQPRPPLKRTDSKAIRSAILSLSAADARKLAIRRNTL
jgi:hypothetical protein